MLSFFPGDVLGEIWDLIESVSESFPTYSSYHNCSILKFCMKICVYKYIKIYKNQVMMILISSSTTSDLGG